MIRHIQTDASVWMQLIREIYLWHEWAGSYRQWPLYGYIWRLQNVSNSWALSCPEGHANTLLFNGGKRILYGFHAVDRGSNPLGDANQESKLLREIVGAFFVFELLSVLGARTAAYHLKTT